MSKKILVVLFFIFVIYGSLYATETPKKDDNKPGIKSDMKKAGENIKYVAKYWKKVKRLLDYFHYEEGMGYLYRGIVENTRIGSIVPWFFGSVRKDGRWCCILKEGYEHYADKTVSGKKVFCLKNCGDVNRRSCFKSYATFGKCTDRNIFVPN